MPAATASFDLAIIGGGVNGCGIARDAAGRGLKVLLAEQADLGGATSSSSTKLIHGGLRYLEQFEFSLVRESLEERERLWSIAPHIIWPLRFVLPVTRGQRPGWMLRAGLFLYDHIGGRDRLPPTRAFDLGDDPAGKPLKQGKGQAFEYSDCWVQDNRLVVLNARDAAARGADIRVRTKVEKARRTDDGWEVQLSDGSTINARILVNAAGPWVDIVEDESVSIDMPGTVRLVKGSHIVVPRLYGHTRCYFFQNPDKRIFFAIPYERDYTLIGTTEEDYTGDPATPHASSEEIAYLCQSANRYFEKSLTPEDVVWTYSGVRPLYSDGRANARETSRDFELQLDAGPGKAPFLSIYGGKITTYRRLAEAVLERLADHLPATQKQRGWTAREPLPGGEFGVDEVEKMRGRLAGDFPFLDAPAVDHFLRHYGTKAWHILEGAKDWSDLGRDFGGGLTEAEAAYLRDWEWARTAEDIVWHRTKYGLRMSEAAITELNQWLGN
ncbi:glycerol-3-phosphate dehydrogenase [Cucumibacter marinus]|uniref:glycerol-3-phosphate dehydrogenase n=1 Tax=Cucumibacter marinus TaxID=1121252 RepID=UPI00040C7209|nr:glycerol-3-phosphate dehydrogenase [Cucumibacter marinus]